MCNSLKHIEGFKLKFDYLRKSDLALLCKWRNSDYNRQYMDDTRYVTLPIMLFWYNKITRFKTTYPYIFTFRDNPAGYYELKNFNYDDNSCEEGIILDDKLIGVGIGAYLALCREKILRIFNIKTIISKVSKFNSKAIAFQEYIGARQTGIEGDFLVMSSEMEARNNCLESLAKKLNLSNEWYFFQYSQGANK